MVEKRGEIEGDGTFGAYFVLSMHWLVPLNHKITSTGISAFNVQIQRSGRGTLKTRLRL
jgi:hypothetical protein